MSLVAGRGPFGHDPAGWFTPPVALPVVFAEPHPRRIRAVLGGRTVLDTEHALLVHRLGAPLGYAFPEAEVGALPHEAEPVAPGYVRVPWDAVDEWYEEGRRLVHYPPNPYHRVDCRPTSRRLSVTVEDVLLVDTDATTIVFETSLEPRLYVAPIHVRTEVLRRSETQSYCNYKGLATYWSAVIGGSVIEDVAWSYDEPLPESEQLRGYVSFDATRCAVSAELPAQ